MSMIYKAVCQLLSQTLSDSGEVMANKNCCLCYNPVDPEAVRLGDEVAYDTLYGEHWEEMSEIVNNLLGDDVFEIAKLFKSICTGCTKQVITCYKFVKKCKENAEQFNFAFENLSVCFHNTADNLYHFQSMYVAVNPSEIEQFYDIKRYPKEVAFARFNHLQCTNSQYYMVPKKEDLVDETQKQSEIKTKKKGFSSISIKTYNLIEGKQKKSEKKTRKKDFSTIFIKTHELMADPSKKKEYKCKMCFKLYPSAGALRFHFFSVHFKKEFQCKECPKSFGTAGLLNTHMKECHSTVECETCHKQLFNRTSTIKRHQLTHLPKLNQVCNRCGRMYKKLPEFQRHMAQQTCAMPSRVPGEFVCDYCGKLCHFKHQLISHIRHEHLDAKGYICKWCGRKCYNESSLKVHVLKHTKEKNFICSICGGKFVTRQSLINHTRLHTGERPYPCQHCEQSFLSASRRKEHIERYHTDAKFSCDLCDATFSARRSLVKHRKRHELLKQEMQ